MKSRHVFGTLLVFCLFLCVSALNCTKSPQHGYKYKKGQTQEFMLWINQQVEPDGGKLAMFRRNIWGKLTLSVVESTPKILRFTLKMSDIRARQVRFDAQRETDETKRIPGIEALNGLTWTVSMKPDGSDQQVTPPKEYERHVADIVQTTNQTFREMFPSLPSRIVKDQRWQRHIEGPITGDFHGEDIRIATTLDYHAQRIEDEKLHLEMALDLDLGDNKTHKIKPAGPPMRKAKPALSEEKKPEKDSSLVFYGKGEGNGGIQFDLKTGKLLSLEYNTDIATHFKVVRDGTQLENQLVTKSKIELKPYPETPKGQTRETKKAKPASRQVR